MAPSVKIIEKVAELPAKIHADGGTYTDLVGSDGNSTKPIVGGIWYLTDTDKAGEAWTAEWDEVKYVLRGEITLRNEETGEEWTARAGDMIWLPVGSTTSVVRAKDLQAVYVEQRHQEHEDGSK